MEVEPWSHKKNRLFGSRRWDSLRTGSRQREAKLSGLPAIHTDSLCSLPLNPETRCTHSLRLAGLFKEREPGPHPRRYILWCVDYKPYIDRYSCISMGDVALPASGDVPESVERSKSASAVKSNPGSATLKSRKGIASTSIGVKKRYLKLASLRRTSAKSALYLISFLMCLDIPDLGLKLGERKCSRRQWPQVSFPPNRRKCALSLYKRIILLW